MNTYLKVDFYYENHFEGTFRRGQCLGKQTNRKSGFE